MTQQPIPSSPGGSFMATARGGTLPAQNISQKCRRAEIKRGLLRHGEFVPKAKSQNGQQKSSIAHLGSGSLTPTLLRSREGLQENGPTFPKRSPP